MAVTIINRPYYLVPAHNEAWFEASSNQTAQPNFTYYVEVTEETGSNSFIFEIAPDPVSDNCFFNLRTVMEKFVQNFYPIGLYDWKSVIGGINMFTVNIGEKYGSTPSVTPGSDIDIYGWNACLTRKERAEYDPEEYDNFTASTVVCLNNRETSLTIKRDQDLVFYFLETGTSIDRVTVATYDGGGLYNVFEVLNDVINVGTTAGKYICINCGPSSFNDLYVNTPSRVTSPFQSPLFDGTELYYEVNVVKTGGAVTKLYTITIEDPCPRFEDVPLHYLNRKGAYDTINMYGNHRKSLSVEKSFYKGIVPALEESHTDAAETGNFTISPEPVSNSKRLLSSSYQTRRTLETHWLTDMQVENLQDLITGPGVIVENAHNDYTLYSEDDTEYAFKEGILDKQISLEVQLSEGTERRQPG